MITWVKKFYWKLRYTFYMIMRYGIPLKYAWVSACISSEEIEWQHYEPEDQAEEDISYWGD